MQSPNIEKERLDALLRHEMLNTTRDPLFDAIAKATREVCKMPIALIAFVDQERLWVKSATGIEGLDPSRALPFCANTLIEPGGIFEVCDTTKDARFSQNPLVAATKGVKYYAGASLTSREGQGLGTLCLFDYQPGAMNSRQKHALQHMAEAVTSLLHERAEQFFSQKNSFPLEVGSSGVFMLDAEKDFTVTYCNAVYEKLTGRPHNEIIGCTFESLNTEVVNRKFSEQLLSNLSEGRECALTYSKDENNSSPYTSRTILYPILDSSGALTQIFGVQQNITDSTAAGQQLTQARLFLESAPDATLITDESGSLVLANREAEYLFGYAHEELFTMSIEALMPTRFREKHLHFRRQYSNSPTVREMGQGMNIIALTKSGSEIPVDIRLSPIYSDGRLFYSASIRDVTYHANAEVALQNAKSIAENATLQKTRFLAAASHDMRQPLQAIGLYLSVLSRTKDEKKRGEISQKIKLSLDNVNGMLGALLDVSKLDSGSIQPEKTGVELQNIFEKIIAGNSQQAKTKGLRLTCAPTSLIVFTDPVLLERVLDNFIANAIRYTPKGEIIVSAKAVEPNVIVAVSDTGIGVDDSQLDRIFEEYYQIENPSRNRSKGLGLGLSIVKYIAKLLEHEIDVRSDLGEGSTFSITMPLAASVDHEDPENHLKNSETEAGESTLTVLLVEDDPEVLDSTAMLLESEDIEVLTASTGQEGLDLIEAGIVPDMVLTDYRLPGINGCELVLQIRKYFGRDIPAILITGDTAPNEFADTNTPDYKLLHKPVVPEQLMQLIRELGSQSPQ